MTSQSGFVDEQWPELSEMDAWSKLGLLDDLLELVANPVLWFELGSATAPAQSAAQGFDVPSGSTPEGTVLSVEKGIDEVEAGPTLWLPSRLRWELGVGLSRAAMRVRPYGLDAERLVDVLEREVGCRVDASGADLPGLSLPEHASDTLRDLPEPWGAEEFRRLADRLPDGSRLIDGRSGGPVPGSDLVAQAEHLQAHQGSHRSWIGPLRIEV